MIFGPALRLLQGETVTSHSDFAREGAWMHSVKCSAAQKENNESYGFTLSRHSGKRGLKKQVELFLVICFI